MRTAARARVVRAAHAIAVLALLGAGCAGAPQPTRLSAPPPELTRASHERAWAAFDLPLRADGSVVREAVRTLGWESAGAPGAVYLALWRMARDSAWDAEPGVGGERRALLVLDGTGRARSRDLPHSVRKRVDAARRARRRAAQALSAGAARAHELDCAWLSVDALRSGAPFLHDEIDGWSELEPELRKVEARDGGVWVCRVARGTHRGQFVFLDAARRVLAIRGYMLGE